MITIYGLTDENGQIRYVGQTYMMKQRYAMHCKEQQDFAVYGMAVLARAISSRMACQLERRWIQFLGQGNLHNKNKGPHMVFRRSTEQTERITTRIPDSLVEKLIEAAGDYGSLSNVVRVILERHFLKAALKGGNR